MKFLCIIFFINSFLFDSFSLFLTTPTPEGMVRVEGGKMKYNKKSYTIKSFFIDEHEVTLAQFNTFVKATGYLTHPEKTDGCDYYDRSGKKWEWKRSKEKNWRHDGLGRERNLEKEGNLPVANITVRDAMAYAKWAGKRLPTVQEWIYAASGGKKSKGYRYSGSNKAALVAWYEKTSNESVQPVMTKLPNELGLYDMSGNLMEFALDATSKDFVHVRGGAFFNETEWLEIRDPNWDDVSLDLAKHEFGFRCVKDVP